MTMYHAVMGRRIEIYLDESVIDELNQHTQVSPLSRSELVGVALRRFFRQERARCEVDVPATEMARRIAAGELPSNRLDGPALQPPGSPWEN